MDEVLSRHVYIHLINSYVQHKTDNCVSRELNAVIKALEKEYPYLIEFGYRKKEKAKVDKLFDN